MALQLVYFLYGLPCLLRWRMGMRRSLSRKLRSTRLPAVNSTICLTGLAPSTQAYTGYLPGGIPLVRFLIRFPRNPIYNFMLLAFLWYQHAVVSGYGMLDDLKLGFRNLGQILGRSNRRGRGSFLDTIDMGEATVK